MVKKRQEARDFPAPGVSSIAVVVIGFGVLVVLAVLVAILLPGPDRKVAEPSSTTRTARFDQYGLTFDYPRTWTPESWPVVSSFSSLITYLSPLTLHDPCIRVAYSISCGYPLTSLPPAGVLISWEEISRPHPPTETQITSPNTTIGSQTASLTIAYPGHCGPIGADETVTAEILRPPGGLLQMTACLRAPDTAMNEALVRQMLASVQISPS